MNKVDVELDAQGLSCPLPLLKAKQALNAMNSGQILAVRATDSGSVRDFKVFAEQSGHLLIESFEDAGVYNYLLKKK
jgi:tRNA 2-thiouridine synthesizing protein A